MKERRHEAGPQHEALFQELTEVIHKHSANLSPAEILAICANMTGKVLAMQDQRTTTPQSAMNTILRNIELGNAQIIEGLKAAGRKT